ncbi:DUF4395 family protein [Leptospira adleri]|uniref:DUF4395 family protein n=1 Tax=Leptospira adleri TaxID=2023186 RepID=UPI0010830CBE|nr:DUF4395 family protein [Leptospira adleri]TGM58914.1 DUF4395 family protein [Leptospira adleri]
MEERSKLNFIQQQGFNSIQSLSCGLQYSSLLWQPRVIGILVLFGIGFQLESLFLILSLALFWGALFPRFNIFDLIYNRFWGIRKDRVFLTPAPPPRRFSQGLGGGLMLGIWISLFAEWKIAAICFETFLVIGLSAPILSKFCIPAYIYHVIRGEIRFANRTLPWYRG